jgi:hypothetical protein
MNDSWNSFADMLRAERDQMRVLNVVAMEMTNALVENDATAISLAERKLEVEQSRHNAVFQRRVETQKRGFGDMSIASVIAYAPREIAWNLYGDMCEIQISTHALGLTNENNKSLILAGMDRLMKTVAIIQRAGNEQPGTYKRRGTVPPPDGSVLVSRRA